MNRYPILRCGRDVDYDIKNLEKGERITALMLLN